MIRRKLSFSNTPNYGGTGTSDAFVKINDWGMSLSNQNNTIDFNVDTNLPANITLNYELVGANTDQIPGGVTGNVTLDSNSDFTLSATIDPYYDTTNTSNTTINLTLTSPDSNAVVASAPDLILRQAEALVATGGTTTIVSGGTENLPANYTLHELADGDTFSITNRGSNANLTLYGFVVAGGGGAAYGDTVNPGGGGGGGGIDSGNVKLGLGSFANTVNSPSGSAFEPAGFTFNGNVLPTDSFIFNSAATAITDGEVGVPVHYFSSNADVIANINNQSFYFVKNTDASNVNVNVYSAYTDAALTTPLNLYPGDTTYGFGSDNRAIGIKLETSSSDSYYIEIGSGGIAETFVHPNPVPGTAGGGSFMGALAATGGGAGSQTGAGDSGFGQNTGKAGGGEGDGGGGAGTAGNANGDGGSGTIANILSNASIVYFGGGGAGGRDGITVPSGGIGGGGEDGNPGENGKGGGGSGGQKTTVGFDVGGAGGSGAAYVRYLSEYRTLHL